MALKEINRYLSVVGCSTYELDEKGIPGSYPISIDSEVTLPAITHPTMDAQMMGTFSAVNQTAIENLEMTISLPDSAAASKCRRKGIVGFMVRHAVSISDRKTGEISLGGFTVKARGMISGKEGLTITPSGESHTNLTLQLVSYQFVDDEGNVIVNIDRPSGILEINGEDWRADLKNLL